MKPSRFLTDRLAVVTSAWGDYAQYLPDWAGSIAGQALLPDQVVIIDAGCVDRTGIQAALTILSDGGIDCRAETISHTTMGAARNAAVAATDTDWVMHLDADDTLLEHALADIREVADQADVVSLGAIREGTPVVFPDVSAEKILARGHGMFSCGAFRRPFWERRPWHTRNDFIDSTFWVGLAHLGARFASTGRAGFVYRQHPDSVSHTLTAAQRQLAARQWKRACSQWTLN